MRKRYNIKLNSTNEYIPCMVCGCKSFKKIAKNHIACSYCGTSFSLQETSEVELINNVLGRYPYEVEEDKNGQGN